MKKGDKIIAAGIWNKTDRADMEPIAYVSTPAEVKSWGKRRGTIQMIEDGAHWEAGDMAQRAIYNPQAREGVCFFRADQTAEATAAAREIVKKDIIRIRKACKHNMENSASPAFWEEQFDLMNGRVDSRIWETCEVRTVNATAVWH